ncbi:MAG: GGDEF domain-containing protein, partial [Methylococcaceae bacterium]
MTVVPLAICSELHGIVADKRLLALYQPIVDIRTSAIAGYEGLVRGPSNSSLHAVDRLLSTARQCGLFFALESACADVLLRRFVQLNLPGRLFINFTPDSLAWGAKISPNWFESLIVDCGIEADRVVIELNEADPFFLVETDELQEILANYLITGCRLTVDDLGESSSMLNRWSQLRPAYVKIGRHFIQNIDKDPVKSQFIRAIQSVAAKTDTLLVAQGVETHEELMMVRDLGIVFVQGYHIGRPTSQPSPVTSAEVVKGLSAGQTCHLANNKAKRQGIGAYELIRRAPSVSPETSNDEVFQIFQGHEELQSVVVVQHGNQPVGLMLRSQVEARYARPYQHELVGRKPCTLLMDPEPLIVDISLSIQEVSQLVVDSDPRHLVNGFIVTDQGQYVGVGSGHDLMREITALQIRSARYANPLTQLPGNTPISEHVTQLLENNLQFAICYCDLDHFKPYNDVYGFSCGDNLIRMTAKVLEQAVDPEYDFLGHIGGDDFIVVYRSTDWQARCQTALQCFGQEVAGFFSADDRERGGYVTENRKGEKEFHPLTSLSIGALEVAPGAFNSYLELSRSATEAKKMAKKTVGNSLFVDRRRYNGGEG